MTDMFKKLKQKEIINNDNIIEIKEQISKAHPHISAYEAAILFASSIHKIIDKNIRHLDKEARDAVKKDLIKNSVDKKGFSINAEDVFNTYVKLNKDDDNCTDSLVRWMNESQNLEVSKEDLLSHINKIRKIDLDNNIETTQIRTIDNDNVNFKRKGKLNIISNSKNKPSNIIIGAFIITFCSLTILVTSYNYMRSSKADDNIDSIQTEEIKAEVRLDNELPPSFKYREVDKTRLKAWLNNRNSLLADEPYLTTIINTAEEFNINPLLIIAIAGQEQGFVPRSNENAEQIANNPFNVFGSWIAYNTDIKDSSKIVARTIVNLSKDKPDEVHVIQWINRKYAEDQNWHKGVIQIFNKLNEEVGQTDDVHVDNVKY